MSVTRSRSSLDAEAKDPPSHLPEEGILLGYSLEHERRTAPIGFTYGTGSDRTQPASSTSPTLDPILHTGGGHLMTIAPTGAGKGVGCIVPSLLRFPGPVIVIDPKGENYAVTAERRRQLGQQVVVLDPIGITDARETGALNPLDLVDHDSAQSIDDAAALASLLSGGVEKEDPRNLFWYQRGAQLLTGVIQFVASERPPEQRHLGEVRRLLNLPTEQFTQIASTEMMRSPDPDVRQVAGSLANPASEMIGSILGMSQNSLGFLRGPLLQEATASSTFELDAVTAGDPLSIFIVIPPDKLESHRNLLRLWIGALMSALMRRRAPVPHPTLLVLDEAAQLGPLEQLRQAITLMRGYGLQTWSFWQDASQLENLYPRDWETMYNNCRVHQAFGFTTLKAAEDTCELVGFHDPVEALQLDSDEMVLSVSGDEAVIAQKPNYLTDPAFEGLYAPNPFYSRTAETPPEPRRRKRLYVRPSTRRPDERQVIDEVSAEVDPDEEDEEDESEEPMDIERLFESVGSTAPEAPEGPVRGASLLDPLPGVEVDYPKGVYAFLEMMVDQIGGSWNPVTTHVRGVGMSFYPACHIVEVIDPMHDPSRQLVLKKGPDMRVFSGRASEFDRLNREAPVGLTDDDVGEYLRLRLHFRRGHRRLRVVDTPERLAFWRGGSNGDLTGSAELIEPIAVEEGTADGWTVTGTALSEGALVRFRTRVAPDGAIAPIEREVLVQLEVSDGYPTIGLEGSPLEPELSRRLEVVHGRWEILDGGERASALRDFSDYARQLAGDDVVLVRRPLSCYPDWDLVRIPAPQRPERQFYFHRPGQVLPCVTGSGEWLSVMVNSDPGSSLEIANADQAAEYLRFFTWFVGGPESYWLVLDEAEQVPLADDFALDSDVRDELRAAWTPLSPVPLREEDGESVRWRFKATLLHGNRVVSAEFKIEADGSLEMTDSAASEVELQLEDELLERLLALPPLGIGG